MAGRRAMRRAHCRGNVRPGAKAGIDEALDPQLLERGRVDMAPLRLDQDPSVMIEPQPGQVLEDRPDKLWAAAARIEILDAQPEVAA